MPRRTILVVEDDTEQQRLYGEIFAHRGWHVVHATDGDRAIEEALRMTPSVILLDLMLPKKGGLHVLRILKTLPETKDIPVVTITAYPNPEYREESLSGGATMHLLKSEHSHAQMADKIEELIGTSK